MPDATERKILLFCAFFACLLLLAPQEFVGAGMLAGVLLLMLLAHRLITSREDELLGLLEQWAPAPPSPSDAPPEGEEATSEGT
jgi:hypothetical protein